MTDAVSRKMVLNILEQHAKVVARGGDLDGSAAILDLCAAMDDLPNVPSEIVKCPDCGAGVGEFIPTTTVKEEPK